nr:hypothetical protein CFP56_68658 [Quercus suber]
MTQAGPVALPDRPAMDVLGPALKVGAASGKSSAKSDLSFPSAFTCLYARFEIHPALPIVRKLADICSAGAGFLFGGTAGILKNTTPFVFATASSIRCFGLGASYWVARGTIIQAWTTTEAADPSTKVAASAIAGGLSGGTIAALTRGRSNVIPGILMWSFFGGAGQWTADQWIGRDRAEETIPFFKRIARSKWSPIQVMTDEDYAKVLSERMLKVEVEISMLDDKIAVLKTQQQKDVVENQQGRNANGSDEK